MALLTPAVQVLIASSDEKEINLLLIDALRYKNKLVTVRTPYQKIGGLHMINKQNKELIHQIKSLTHFSLSVYHRLQYYAIRNDINLENKDHFISLVLHQLEENLSIDLSDKKSKELEEIKNYWNYMDGFITEITDSLSLDRNYPESIEARQDVLTGNVETFETIDDWWQSINE